MSVPHARGGIARSRAGGEGAAGGGRRPIAVAERHVALDLLDLGRSAVRALRPSRAASSNARPAAARQRVAGRRDDRRASPAPPTTNTYACRSPRCGCRVGRTQRTCTRSSTSPAEQDDQVEQVPSHAGRSRELVADLAQRADRVLLHRDVDLVPAELRLLEEAGQACDRVGARGEPEQDPSQVLDRRLARHAAKPVASEHRLHPRVGGDHGAARVGLGLEVVDRVDRSSRRGPRRHSTRAARLRTRACASATGRPRRRRRRRATTSAIQKHASTRTAGCTPGAPCPDALLSAFVSSCRNGSRFCSRWVVALVQVDETRRPAPARRSSIVRSREASLEALGATSLPRSRSLDHEPIRRDRDHEHEHDQEHRERVARRSAVSARAVTWWPRPLRLAKATTASSTRSADCDQRQRACAAAVLSGGLHGRENLDVRRCDFVEASVERGGTARLRAWRPSTGKRAIVTGASSGIGAATARALDGGRRPRRTRARAATARSTSPIPTSSSGSSSRALDELGGLDILVNNAGLSRGRDPVWESSEEDEREVIETNVLGLMRMTRLCVPYLVEDGGGHIVNSARSPASGRTRTARRMSPRSSPSTATRARCATTCRASRCGSRTSRPASSRRTSRRCASRATRRRRHAVYANVATRRPAARGGRRRLHHVRADTPAAREHRRDRRDRARAGLGLERRPRDLSSLGRT